MVILILNTLGYLILVKAKPFSEDEQVLAEISSFIVQVHIHDNRSEMGSPDLFKIKRAFNSLTHTEIKVVTSALLGLNSNEGVINTSTITDRLEISRPVIFNGFRKLEVNGIISTRSLGGRGTYIKVLIPEFISFLQNQGQENDKKDNHRRVN